MRKYGATGMYSTLPRRPKKSRRVRRDLSISALFLGAALIYGGLAVARPFAQLQPNAASSQLSITIPPAKLPWPSYGQAAFGLASDGKVISTNGTQKPIPTASTAKLITALCVMQKKPLESGQPGPTITFTAADTAIYNKYVAQDGSVVAVTPGQQLTERQALEAMLLPSANNMADSLAIWAFGSLAAYTAYANQYLTQHGLTDTHVGSDASGFSPDTTSTASDLVQIGALVMQTPTLASIVGEPSAPWPYGGTVRNFNEILGQDGISGVKTGNSDQDPGVFVGAAAVNVGNQKVTLISAIAGGPSLPQVLSDSRTLLNAAKTSFIATSVMKKGDVLGSYKLPQGGTVTAVAARSLNVIALRGTAIKSNISLRPIDYRTKIGESVGTIIIPASSFSPAASSAITLSHTPPKPSVLYRLLHP